MRTPPSREAVPASTLPTPPAVIAQDEGWISLVRVLVLLAMIPAVWLGVLRVWAANGIIVLLGGYVILLALGPIRLPALRRADLVVVTDLLVTTLLVVASGNLNSPFLYVYYLTILEASAQLNLRQTMAASSATAGMILLLWVLAGQAEALKTPGFRLGAFIAGGFLLALFSGILTQEWRAVRERMHWAALLDRRLSEATARLGEQLGELQFYTDLAARLSGELQLGGVLRILLQAFLETVGLQRGAAYVCDEQGRPCLVLTHGAAIEGPSQNSDGAVLVLPAGVSGGELLLRPGPPTGGSWGPIAACVPLVRGTHLRAWLCGLGDPPVAIRDSAYRRVHGIAAQGAAALDAARLHKQMEDLAATDSLTGLANRRCFLDRLTSDLAHCRRTGRRLSVAMVDLDGFKTINDTHGHAAGDAVLVAVAKHLGRSARASDLVARFGGDEFVLLFPETNGEEAERVLERLRIGDIAVRGGNPRSLRLSFSWGIATWPEDGMEIEPLLHTADRRLYAMKQRHRGGKMPGPSDLQAAGGKSASKPRRRAQA